MAQEKPATDPTTVEAVALARVLINELTAYAQILSGEADWPNPLSVKLKEAFTRDIAAKIASTYQDWFAPKSGPVEDRAALFRACAIVGKKVKKSPELLAGGVEGDDACYKAVLFLLRSSRPAAAANLWRARAEILAVVHAHQNKPGRGKRAKLTLSKASENLAIKLGYPAKLDSLKRARSRSRKTG